MTFLLRYSGRIILNLANRKKIFLYFYTINNKRKMKSTQAKMKSLFLMVLVFSATQLFSQITVPTSGSSSYTVCSGVLYDSGGQFSNYSSNSNGYAVLNPSDVGNMIQVSGTTGGPNCCDIISIYNGVGLGGNLLWSGHPGGGPIPLITSTSGPLTVSFYAGFGITGSGFALTINCVAPTEFIVPSTGNNSYTLCSGVLYDAGGANSDYSNNSNGYTVLNPINPGNFVRVSGSSAGDNCCDFINIYDGVGLGGNLLWAGYPGGGVIPIVTSTSGSLTIQFTSNGNTVGSGFALDISCAPLQYLTVPSSGSNVYNVCSGTLYDAGGPNFNYSNNSYGYTILNPGFPGNMVQVSGTSGGPNCCDVISIYNGAGLGGNLLWTGFPGGGPIPTITSTSGPLTVLFSTSSFGNTGSGFTMNFSCVPSVDFIVPTSGHNSYTVCSGVLYDAGGPNNDYSNNSNGYTVLNPSNPGNFVRVSGITDGEDCCDFIKIYNGTGLGGNLLWAGNPSAGTIPTITSTVGPLTIEFTSNGNTVGSGFALDIICMPLAFFTVPTSGNNSYSVCSGALYDSGGPNFNFVSDANGYSVLNPSNPGTFLQVNGNYSGDNCCDFLSIYDGAGLSGNLLWSSNLNLGSTIPTITSTTGPLTVLFTSSFAFVGAGFSLNINCLDTSSCLPTIFISSNQGTNICDGEEVIYSASVTNGGANPTYQWKRNGIDVGTSSTYTSSTNSDGDVITCELTSTASCADPAVVTSNSLVLEVNVSAAAIFTQVPAICDGSFLAPLPTTSNNGIEGLWSPALNNTTTTTYTFTPTAGQCGTGASMTIAVNLNATTSFTQVEAICEGDVLSALPTTSNNGIAGSWSPELNNISTTTYTFTPDAGQCGIEATMTIAVNPNATPSFTQVDAICEGGFLSPLPTTSNNGFAGSWSPALNNSGTTTYTFAPSAGQCATEASMTIAVNSNVTSIFTQIEAICEGDALLPLPTTSNNGIAGSWSPALNNMSTTTYTFAPNVGECGTETTMTILVNPNAPTSFTQVESICEGDALSPLPTTSDNGIAGAWSPALNNMSTTTYTFTPNVGQCGTEATMTITVNPNTTPSFTQADAICAGEELSSLPTTSNNGIAGSWSPALNTNSTTTYTFIPNAGLCVTNATMTIAVNQIPDVFLALNGTTLITNPGYSAYVWTLNGSIIEGANTNEINVSENGNYAVTVTDANECIGSAAFNVQTIHLEEISSTNAFSVFPNPGNETTTLSIELSESQEVKILILDLQGKLQFQKEYTFNVGKNKTLLDLNELSDGIYFIQLDNSEIKETIRFAKMSN
jgi:hypothetical protein